MLVFVVSTSFAASAEVSKEGRQKMAGMHAKMADCMKSDKPMADCQSDMMKSCQDMMGKSGCPMKGMMGGPGMMMNHEEETKPDKKSKE